jgi:hypothetical protein
MRGEHHFAGDTGRCRGEANSFVFHTGAYGFKYRESAVAFI